MMGKSIPAWIAIWFKGQGMKLQEIFDALWYGELSQVFQGGTDATEGIREEDRKKVISHIQLGLTSLHRRFNIRVGEFVLELQPGQTVYVLSKEFAQSNTKSAEPVKYIRDNQLPFEDDLFKIERIYDKNECELPFNESMFKGIRTLRNHVLVVPESYQEKTDILHILYRANHPKIDTLMGEAVPFMQEIELPDMYLQALLYFVGSRVMNPIGINQEFHDGNNYAKKYELECMRLEQENFQIDDIEDNNKFHRSGFV